MNSKVLIVEDDHEVRRGFRMWVEDWGYEPVEAEDASTGERLASENDIVAALLDYKLPDFNGIELFRRINRLKPGTPVIMITGHHRPELTMEAMAEGLYHYMSKPVDMEELKIHLDRAIGLRRMTNDYHKIKSSEIAESFIGCSPQMLEVFRRIGMFANQSNPVLIVGETGTGKELVARALHRCSDRRSEKFVTLLIPAIAPTLIESELFGHEKGAFTDAKSTHKGRFESAGKGTLFIDELADIPISTQSKLLRVLEGHAFKRVGGEDELRNEARLIFATQRNPEKLVKQDKLREDLFFRLDVCRIDLPPLRERSEDIPELVDFFIGRENAEQKRDIEGVEDTVLETWTTHDWPGNVRQLQNTIRRAVALTRDRIITGTFLEQPDLPAPSETTHPTLAFDSEGLPNLKELIPRIEQDAIRSAYSKADGNLSKAAQLIGLTRREMERRIEKYGMRLE